MRRIVRGLAIVGLVAGVGFAVYTITRLAREGSAEQFDDFAPTPPAPTKKEQDDPKPSDKPAGPAHPDSEQWPLKAPGKA
jgi:hypothetical protein